MSKISFLSTGQGVSAVLPWTETEIPRENRPVRPGHLAYRIEPWQIVGVIYQY